ncbi:glycosyltransferase [Arthrobacter glacialis]|nr:glycosyltransferase [Arthrobacter glacialis]
MLKTTEDEQPLLRIIWVTNVAAPYRLPVWEELGSISRLDVVLLENNASLSRGHRNRGSDWKTKEDAERSFSYKFAKAIRVSAGAGRYYIGLGGIIKLVRGCDAILLGGWESPAYWQLLFWAKIFRKRTVGFYESTLASNKYSGGPIAHARTRFFKSLNAVVVPGKSAAEAIGKFGVEQHRIFTGFNAVDVKEINTVASQIRAEVPISGGTISKNILFVGQLIKRKNIHSLINALFSIGDPEYRLTIVGEGPEELSIRALCSELDLNDQIEFLGPVEYEAIPEILARHATLVLPSTEEVWGLIVNEALAAGIHVVVSDVCGVVASIKSMSGVFDYHGNDSTALASAIKLSSNGWAGPIVHPDILEYTPALFAHMFYKALAACSVDSLDLLAPVADKIKRT